MLLDSFSQKALYRLLPAICAFILLTAFFLFATGCANVGRDFPTDRVSGIQVGKTTKNDIRSMFGSPWRIGAKDGQLTWTYGKYQYRLIGDTSTQDLVIRFNDKDIVVSYTFNTTEHNE
jgi:hypothetical protein